MRKTMATKEIESFLEIGKLHKDWIDKFVVISAFCMAETVYSTAALTFKVLTSGLQGSLCECGVAAGAHPAVMQYCMRFTGQHRKVYMFDSFDGIPHATSEDIPDDDHIGDDIRKCIGDELAEPGIVKTTGITSVSLPEVKDRMARWGAEEKDLVYVPGWFQITVPTTDTGPLAILRLDGDLYESTRVCMKHLYPKLVPGGFCIIDDWHLAGVKRAVREYFNDYDEDESSMPRMIKVIQGMDNPCTVFWRKAVR